jgi:hypothetical protein
VNPRFEAIDPESGEVVPLFDPRRHRWEGHFGVAEHSARLVGLTPIGRATIARLRLNQPAQLAARRQWMRLRLFPSF